MMTDCLVAPGDTEDGFRGSSCLRRCVSGISARQMVIAVDSSICATDRRASALTAGSAALVCLRSSAVRNIRTVSIITAAHQPAGMLPHSPEDVLTTWTLCR